MIANFYDAFGKDTDLSKEIPSEILDLLSNNLPKNFMYTQDTDGEYHAVPRPDRLTEGIKLTTQFDLDEAKDAALIKRLKIVPREKWPEYLYRIQQAIPVKNLKLGNEDKVIPIEETIGNPLGDKHPAVTEAKMFPQPFPEPITLLFETAEGDTVSIKIQQQAYDSVTEIKFLNVNFPALKVELYQYAPLVDDPSCEESVTNVDSPMRLTYSVMPSKAQTVKDAIAALRIFKGLFEGTAKINKQAIAAKLEQSTLNLKQIEDALNFWMSALQLEDKLGVSFSPSADFPMDDVKFFSELQACLIERKEITWKHPFSHFHIGGFHPTVAGSKFEDYIGKDNICYKFTEGPIEATLLGAKFNIYSHTEIRDFIITNIDWDDEAHESGEIYIADAPGKVSTLSRLYITESDFNTLQ